MLSLGHILLGVYSMTVQRPVGRPSKYTPELQAIADTYIFDYTKHGDVIPSRAGLCCFLGISRSTSFEWEDSYPEFSDTVSNIEVMQENRLCNKGLDGTFNPAITKLLLHNHGHSDKVVQDLTSTDGSMSPKETGAAVLDALKRKHADPESDS